MKTPFVHGSFASARRLCAFILNMLGFIVIVVSALKSYHEEEYYGLYSSSSSSRTTTAANASPSSSVIISYDDVKGRSTMSDTTTNIISSSSSNGLDISSNQVYHNNNNNNNNNSRRRRRPFGLLSRLGSLVNRRPFQRKGSHSSNNNDRVSINLIGYSKFDQDTIDLASTTDELYYETNEPVVTSRRARRGAINNNNKHILARLRTTLRGSKKYDIEETQSSLQDSDSAADTEAILDSLIEPLMTEDAWEGLSGNEFLEHPERIDALVAMGEGLARQETKHDDWVKWNPYGSHQNPIEEGNIHVWVGKSGREGHHGSKVPWIKTKSIVPLSPEEMADLLLDSERVQSYNQLSLGRQDVWVKPPDKGVNNQQTKIVKNRTKIPMNKKPMVSVTMMHSRPLESEPGAWLVISRAAGGTAFMDKDDIGSSRSDILLGVNLLQPVPGDDESCILTGITHVYTSAVPSMLAEQLGVKGAIKFVKDLRNLKVSVAAN